MTDQAELERLRKQVAQYEKLSYKTNWLLARLGLKLRNFPRDFSRRMRKSAQKKKRKAPAPVASALATGPSTVNWDARISPARVAEPFQSQLQALYREDPRVAEELDRMRGYFDSPEFAQQIQDAARLEPMVCETLYRGIGLMVPWHDAEFSAFKAMLGKLPEGAFDNVLVVPFGKMGGADFVAGILAQAVAPSGSTIILRTDQPDWVRPDWYPESVPSVDLSGELGAIQTRSRALYLILQELRPKRIYNVNSRLMFDVLREYGARLRHNRDLYAYYFCADRDPHGNEAGYPVYQFLDIFPHLTAALIDTRDLADTLRQRFAMTGADAARLRTIYTPAMGKIPPRPVVEAQIETAAARSRPVILWAGRLDRQKRFDLVVEIATQMPQVDFHAWGSAVLDQPPDTSALPENLTLHPPFKSFEDLPLAEADGWLYTSAWDGLPTILIECGALGVPIVASAVGGVPELVDETTGWPVRAPDDAGAYVAALTAMLESPEDRRRRATALQARVRARHTVEAYRESLALVRDPQQEPA